MDRALASRRGAACSSTEEQRDRIADTLRLAEALGGEAITIPGGGRRIADDVIDYAHANNVTQIIIGKSTRSRWFEMLHGSVVHDLVRRSGNISVHVIAGDELPSEPMPQDRRCRPRRGEPFDPRPYLMAPCSRSRSALGVAALIRPLVRHRECRSGVPDRGGRVAVRYGLWPSLFASVAASLCYNFFFLPPIYTFTITDPTNVAAFFFFIAHGGAGLQCRRARAHAGGRRDRRGRARPSRSMPSAASSPASATLDDVLWATAYQTALMLKVRVVLLLPEDGIDAVKAGYPPEDKLDEADLAAAKWAWQQRSPGRARLGHAAGRQAAVPADAHRARRDRRHRHRQRQAPGRC